MVVDSGRCVGGGSIGVLIPRADYDATVAFYVDLLGFPVAEPDSSAAACRAVRFGSNMLRLDRIENYSRSEPWLQLRTPDLGEAMARLASAGIAACDEVAPFGPGLRCHWIKNPAGVLHLLSEGHDEELEAAEHQSGRADFTGSVNIAMKIPAADYDATVTFYRDVLGLAVTAHDSDQPTVSRVHGVRFGSNMLWLDCIENYSRSDLWLQVRTPDLDAAMATLSGAGIEPCDEVEPLIGDFRGHWIKNPTGIVHLVAEGDDE